MEAPCLLGITLLVDLVENMSWKSDICLWLYRIQFYK